MTLRSSISSIYPNSPAVYTIILPTGHFYIGSTVCLSKRLRDHRGYLDAGRHQNFKMQRLYTNWNDITVHFTCFDDREDAYDQEQYLIDRHYDDEFCINISTDARSLWGNGRGRPSEVSQRISEAQKGKVVSEEFREKCRQRMLGNVQSEVTRQRRSETMKGRTFSDEHRENLSKAMVGKSRPKTREAEMKRQATIAARGGIKHTEESRRKIAEFNMIPVICEGIRYQSMGHAASALGITIGGVKYRIESNSIRFKDYSYA